MDAFESRVLRELRTAVNEAISSKLLNIGSGALSDHAAYKQHCGIIQGMRDALQMAEDIEKRLNGDD